MTSSLYRSYLRLLEKWPVEVTKKGRDLGEYIRLCVAEQFRNSDPRDTQKCEDIQAGLSRIASNRYKEAFYVSTTSSASGLSEAECQQLTSNEFFKILAEDEKSATTVLKEKISNNKKADK